MWTLPSITQYGEDSVTVLLYQYGGKKTAVSLEGEEYEKMGLVSSEVKAEWKTFKVLSSQKNTGRHGISIT